MKRNRIQSVEMLFFTVLQGNKCVSAKQKLLTWKETQRRVLLLLSFPLSFLVVFPRPSLPSVFSPICFPSSLGPDKSRA